MSKRVLELFLNGIKLSLEPYISQEKKRSLVMSSPRGSTPPPQLLPIATTYSISSVPFGNAAISAAARPTNQLSRVERKPNTTFKIDADSTALDALIGAFNTAAEKLTNSNMNDAVCAEEIKSIVTTLTPHVATKNISAWIFGSASYSEFQDMLNKIIVAGNTHLSLISELTALEAKAAEEKRLADEAEKAKKAAEEQVKKIEAEKQASDAAKNAAEAKQKELQAATALSEQAAKKAEESLAEQKNAQKGMMELLSKMQVAQERAEAALQRAEEDRLKREEAEQKRLADKAAKKKKKDDDIASLKQAIEELRSYKAQSEEEKKSLEAKNKQLSAELLEAQSARADMSMSIIADQSSSPANTSVSSLLGHGSSSNRSVSPSSDKSATDPQAILLAKAAHGGNNGSNVFKVDPQEQEKKKQRALLEAEEKVIKDLLGVVYATVIKYLSILMHINKPLEEKTGPLITKMLLNYQTAISKDSISELQPLIDNIVDEETKAKAIECMREINAAIANETEVSQKECIDRIYAGIQQRIVSNKKEKSLTPAIQITGELRHLAKGTGATKTKIVLGDVVGLGVALEAKQAALTTEHKTAMEKVAASEIKPAAAHP